MEITNLFFHLARTHGELVAFEYKPPYEKGAGNSPAPYLSLEDPYLTTVSDDKKLLEYAVNFNILYGAKEPVSSAQYKALQIALELFENVKKIDSRASLSGISMISLSDYSDANEAGQRVSVRLKMPNFVNRCDPNYNPSKELQIIESLPSFSVANPNGCAVFASESGLPKISL